MSLHLPAPQADRVLEYNPYNNRQFGKGEGKLYAAFLARTLKPFIDVHYRTRAAPASTIICGSSMGGLISYYTAIAYPDVFGRAGVFSPSFWIAPEIYPATDKALSRLSHSGFYFYGGAKEGDSLETRLYEMKTLLDRNPAISSKVVIDPGGQHQEVYWRKAFGPFYQWVLQGQSE